jgi:nicotinamide-nucleotide amidase
MNAEIIAIGSELTSGAKLDTNSQWLSQQLTDLGIDVDYHTTVADDLPANVAVLETAAARAELVLITGGLGPTLDDLTRQAMAGVAGVELELDPQALETIRDMFASRGRSMPQRNEIQAMFPAGSQPLANPIGTAPGIWMEHRTADGHHCRFAAMPGVPSEMYRMFEEQVRPRLPVSGSVIRRARLNCFGIGESDTEQLLGDLTARGREPEVGITAHEATITLRISAHGRTAQECDARITEAAGRARTLLGHYVYGVEDEELEHIVVQQLRVQGLTLASVESGTGGLMSHRLLSVAGSEDCYAGGLILPTQVSQQRELGLPDELFATHGAVCEEVATELAAACRERFAADFALCITTDRDGDTADSADGPAAAIVALASAEGVSTQQVQRLVNPHIHRSRTVKSALNLLRLHLLTERS